MLRGYRLLVIAMFALVSKPAFAYDTGKGRKTDTSDISSNEALRQARKCAELYDFACAESFYKKAIRLESDNRSANAEYGMLLSKYLKRRDESIPYLEKALKGASSSDSLPEILFELAASYHFAGRFEDAKKNYVAVIPRCKSNKDGKELKQKLKGLISQCDYASSYKIPDERFLVVNIGDAVNSPGPEYIPLYLRKDSTILFTARRISYENKEVDGKDGLYYEEIYEARKTNGSLTTASLISIQGEIGNPSHKSIVSVAPDGKTVFLAINGKLYTSIYENKVLSEPVDLGPNVNCSEYQNHVVMTEDGSSLFFSSNSSKGYGGLDIFRSDKQADGTWGPAINLGEAINTPDDEESPALSPDGKKLYFSSRGLPGFGGYDMFSAEGDGKNFTKVKNLGPPVNSPADDLYLTISPDGKSGMFASGRSAGMGDMDIYMLFFQPADEPLQCEANVDYVILAPPELATGSKLLVSALLNGKPIENQEITWTFNDTIIEKNAASFDTVISKNGDLRVHAEYITTLNGKPAKLCADKTIKVGPGITFTGLASNVTKAKEKVTTQIGEKSVESSIQFKPVYFDFDRSFLRSDALVAIAHNIRLLKENPDLMFSLTGHADSRGSLSYNLALSQRRLNAVVNFLVNNGIAKNRILTSIAQGESEPVNGCTDDQKCSEEEYQKNRRVEFSLVRISS